MTAGVAGDPRSFAPPAEVIATGVCTHHPGPSTRLLDGTRITDHWFELPLDHARPEGARIRVYAREYVSGADHDLPWLLFLQGGPGGKGVRQAQLAGWMKEASQRFRILMLDQRGTGLSTAANRNTLPLIGTPKDQADYLVHFRAPSIVQDAELVRLTLEAEPWTVFGQSFGGFCTLSYLSWHPEGMSRALITGGLAPLDGPADRVYRATYQRMRARNEEYFGRFPEDRQVLGRVYDAVRAGETGAAPSAVLPDGSPVTVGRVQMLGMFLGGNTRMDQLHYLLQEAFEQEPSRASTVIGASAGTLTDTFLHGLYQQVSRATNPLYLVMHESIYAQPAQTALPQPAPVTAAAPLARSEADATKTAWAAQRILRSSPDLADFDPARTAHPLLTGEMVFDWYAALDPALTPLQAVTEELARRTDWGPLYDPEALAANTVPTAAAVYTHDVYVDRALSLETASRVCGLRVWETDEFHHDGIGEDGPGILRRLLSLTDGSP
ncbi:alpha/beta fold hydrolase [Citricoccus sp.]|uniref:alpha/beta fold hydrolase n=1 Tax=Citricoccus sp. TaxID=1978372 RepID=UPI0028BEC121|nr:alpha/beta fold hydrolase [Citricoccus sp.]